MRKLFFVVLLFAAPVFCFGQGEGNIWHFGFHAGIDFNSGSPVAIWAPDSTNEGSSTICDANGNFLFSTDGVTVYNSLGAIIGTGLWGSYTATQSATIVPFPASNNLYYIFTVPAFNSTIGVCYSVVDMNLNGGLGGLVSINTQLLDSACEKLTVVRNTNGIDFWVISHKNYSNQFYAFPVTTLGIGIPTVTSIGLDVNYNIGSAGYLKCSPDGQKLVNARMIPANDPIELFDFDATTGILSNYISIPNSTMAYGVCFSPDNTKLYIGYNEDAGINIQQYNLSTPNFQYFPYLILQGTGIIHMALQLAPNGKIYCSKFMENTLGVINNPNLAGSACGYSDNGFTLQTGTITMCGLPNFINNNFAPANCEISLGNDIIKCSNTGNITLNPGSEFIHYTWSDGSTTQSIQVNESGEFSVTVMDSLGCFAKDTITIFTPPSPNYYINSFSDTLDCANSRSGTIDLDVIGGTGSYTYQWSNGATMQDLNNLNAGTYIVTVSDSIGCIVSNPPITIVQVNDLQVSNTSFNNLKCHDDTNGFINVTVLNGLLPNNYEWSNSATTENLNNLTAGTYSVTVSDAGGCTASDTIVISAPNQIVASFFISADTIFCSVTGGTPGYYYIWSTGSIEDFIDSVHYGTYAVTISDHHQCVVVDTVTIPVPSSGNGEINLIVYPSPTNDWLSISGSWFGEAKFEIIDVLGRIIAIYINNDAIWSRLDVHNYAAGIYFLRVTAGYNTSAVKKFVVVH